MQLPALATLSDQEDKLESPHDLRRTTQHTSEFTGISVIIPFYNEAERVGKCLRAVQHSREQLLPDDREKVEVIVVDDHSPIPLAENELPMECLTFRLENNKGVGAARNKGLELAGRSHVLFLDADVVLDQTFFPVCFERLTQQPDIPVLEGPHSIKPANDSPDLFQHYLAISWYLIMSKELVADSKSACFYSGCVIVNRQFLNDLGAFSESYSSSGGEEYELAARLSQLSPGNIIYDEALVSYHHYDSMVSRGRKLLRRSQNMASTAATISTMPFSFKCGMALRFLSGLALMICIPVFPFAPYETFVTYILLSCLFGLADLRCTRYMARHHSLALGFFSILFRQIEYGCLGIGMCWSALQKR